MISYPDQEIGIPIDEDSACVLKDTLKGSENFINGIQQVKNISAWKETNKISFSNIYNTNKYKYIVTPGNNSKLIRESMKRRPWWVEIPNVDSAFNFKWQPVSYRMKFRELVFKSINKQIVNHFEFHKNLSEKSELFFNMQSHWELIKANVFDIMPLQFSIKIDPKKPNALSNALAPFYAVFNLIEESKNVFQGIYSTSDIHSDPIIDESILNVNLLKLNTVQNNKNSSIVTKFKSFNFQKRGSSFKTKFEMPLSHWSGQNFWFLKATNLNRGRGIHVFKDLESLK